MQLQEAASGTNSRVSEIRQAGLARRADCGKNESLVRAATKSRTLLQRAAFAAMSMTASPPTLATDRYGRLPRSERAGIGCRTQKSAAPAMKTAPIDSGRNVMYAAQHENQDMQIMRCREVDFRLLRSQGWMGVFSLQAMLFVWRQAARRLCRPSTQRTCQKAESGLAVETPRI